MPPTPRDDSDLIAFLGEVGSPRTDLEWLRPFVHDLRIIAGGPAPVRLPALASLLAEGAPTSHVDMEPAAWVVAGPTMPTPGPPNRRTRLVAGAMARLAGLGVAAKVGLGAGVAAASVTGAGAAGALPAPVQHAVAVAVDSATPFTFPDSTHRHANPVTTASDGVSRGDDGAPATAKTDNRGNTQADADHPGVSGGSSGVGTGTRATSSDRTAAPGESPPAGSVPTTLPAGDRVSGASPESPDSTGDGPAGGSQAIADDPSSSPVDVEVGGSDGSTGNGRSGSTPAADHRQAVPGRP